VANLFYYPIRLHGKRLLLNQAAVIKACR
jgi:hypothetical protein